MNLPVADCGALEEPGLRQSLLTSFTPLILEILSGVRREDQRRISRGIEIFPGKVLQETVPLQCGI
jgi:hypothetical protein